MTDAGHTRGGVEGASRGAVRSWAIAVMPGSALAGATFAFVAKDPTPACRGLAHGDFAGFVDRDGCSRP